MLWLKFDVSNMSNIENVKNVKQIYISLIKLRYSAKKTPNGPLCTVPIRLNVLRLNIWAYLQSITRYNTKTGAYWRNSLIFIYPVVSSRIARFYNWFYVIKTSVHTLQMIFWCIGLEKLEFWCFYSVIRIPLYKRSVKIEQKEILKCTYKNINFFCQNIDIFVEFILHFVLNITSNCHIDYWHIDSTWPT